MNFLEIDYTKPIETFGDKISFGGEMLLLGIGTVFSVLIIIMITLSLFKLFSAYGKAKSNRQEQAVPAVVEEQPVSSFTASADEEIVAVISAAIAMAESESCGAKFRVVSFKRK